VSPVPRSRRRGESGFTLIELLVVIVILGILSGVVVFAVRGVNDKGRDAAVATEARTLRTAQEAYCAKAGHYGSVEQLMGDALADDGVNTYKFLSDRPGYYPMTRSNTGACNGTGYDLGDPLPAGGQQVSGNPAAKCGEKEGWCTGPPSLSDYGRVVSLGTDSTASSKVLGIGEQSVPFLPAQKHRTSIYDPGIGSMGTWTEGPTFNGLRPVFVPEPVEAVPFNVPGCTLRCGRVLAVVSGIDERSQPGTGWRLYNPEDGPLGSWSDVTGGIDRGSHQTRGVQIKGTNCEPNCGKVLVVGQRTICPEGFRGGESTVNCKFSAAQAELYDPASNSFTPSGIFSDPRTKVTFPQLALLKDGRVLFFGILQRVDERFKPLDPTGTLIKFAKIFDPRTGEFNDAALLPFRSKSYDSGAQLSVLEDGAVLALGVDDSDPKASVAGVYHPNAGVGSWTPVPSCSSTAPGVNNSPGCRVIDTLKDGTVLASSNVNGFQPYNKSDGVFLFDSAQKKWRQTGSLNGGYAPLSSVRISGASCATLCDQTLGVGWFTTGSSFTPSQFMELYTAPL